MLIREFTNNISVNKQVDEFDIAGAIDKMFGTEKPGMRSKWQTTRWHGE